MTFSLSLILFALLLIVISEIQKEQALIDRLIDEPEKRRDKKRDFYKSSAWRKLRYKALKHYEATCMCCGASRESGDQIHVDHILPRSKFPELALDFKNIQILCQSCNMAKSNKDYTDWRSNNLEDC